VNEPEIDRSQQNDRKQTAGASAVAKDAAARTRPTKKPELVSLREAAECSGFSIHSFWRARRRRPSRTLLTSRR
jgi:hypothetical protein